MKSRAGLAWTPIGNSATATLAKKYKLKTPKWAKVPSPKAEKNKKFKAITFESTKGITSSTFIHFVQGPDSGNWYKEGTLGMAKMNFKTTDKCKLLPE